MTFEEYAALGVKDITDGIAAGGFSAAEVRQAAACAIELLDPQVQAFLQVGSTAPGVPSAPLLQGVPIGFKDNMNLVGTRTSCASRMLANYESVYTATCVERALAAGAQCMGKLNMDEFAFGSSTETSAFHPTKNPWDLERVPGGSSGGSAAAVAAGMLTVSLGSDTGGSIRQPASFCGVVGFKPTYGVISRYGVVAFGSSLDQVGPFGRSVADVALVTDAISGHDPRDCTSQGNTINARGAQQGQQGQQRGGQTLSPARTKGLSPLYSSVLAGQREGIKGMRVGIVPEYLEAEGVEPEILAALKTALQRLENLGAELVEVELPNAKAALSAYYVIGPCEAFSNLSRFDSVRYGYRAQGAPDLGAQYEESRAHGFGPEAIRRIMLGSYLLSSGVYDTYYYPAQQVRTLITQDYQRAFEHCDALLTPVSPRTAFTFGEVSDPTSMYLSDIFTIPINIAGNGGLSLPVGLGADTGLPVAVQIIGPQFRDDSIMRVAAALEQSYHGEFSRLAPLGSRMA